MKQLSRSLLQSSFSFPSDLESGPAGSFPEKIVQFGEGNFLRAFADWMVDRLNAETGFAGSIVIVQPIRHGAAALLNEQDGLYTLLLRGISGGKPCESRRIITAVSRALEPYGQWGDVVEVFRRPKIRFLFSNTTEAGISYAEEAFSEGATPETFPAKLTALLHERYLKFSGDPDRGLVIMPCELIDRNGDNLKRIVLRYASEWGFEPDFSRWIESSNFFLNTLVDRIVPGYPSAEAEEILTDLGYNDKLLDTGEVFHLWVIEGPERLKDELPFHRIGLNVLWTDNIAQYRTRKVQILNGAHTSGVPAAFLGGCDTVRDMVCDEDFGAFVRKAVFDEIVPNIDMPEDELLAYAGTVMERFENPFIRHELLSISLNSISKWKVRVLPSLLDYRERFGKLPPALTFSLAALIVFYRGKPADQRELSGSRGSERYPIRDDADVLSFMSGCWDSFEKSGSSAEFAAAVLSNEVLWGQDLTKVDGLTERISEYIAAILKTGMRSALRSLLDDSVSVDNVVIRFVSAAHTAF